MSIFALFLYGLGTLVVITTLLPMWRTPHWWVRLCDFPRFQIAVVGIPVVALLLLTRWPLGGFEIALLSAVALSALWQLSWVWRYIPGAPREVPSAKPVPDASTCITVLTTNVFQKSRDVGALLRIISGTAPDLVFAVETDEWWCRELRAGLQGRYPQILTYPLSNGYGLALFSRFELVDPVVRFLVDDAIPSIKAGVMLPSGSVVGFYGMHPQPPAPGQDSTERDLEMVQVGKEIKRAGGPAMVLGDLNDVAWSPTTSQFKQVGGLVDPRRGRGFFNTYPAGLPGLRYPLDYIFHTAHFAICDMRVLPRFESDHLPLVAKLCLCRSDQPAP